MPLVAAMCTQCGANFTAAYNYAAEGLMGEAKICAEFTNILNIFVKYFIRKVLTSGIKLRYNYISTPLKRVLIMKLTKVQ